MTTEFDDLVAIVTGGASGIGAAIARRLTDVGARVAVLDLRPGLAADDVFGVAVNVTDDASVGAAIDAVAECFGRLDIVINNAGIGAQGEGRACPTSMSSGWRASRARHFPGGAGRPRHPSPTSALSRQPPVFPSAFSTARARVRCCR
jgi:NAD(P)-dependent dehydrogenase (short-subunit alcohol dehydrogenase family)